MSKIEVITSVQRRRRRGSADPSLVRITITTVLWHDGQGMCLFAKRLERGRFVWPSTAPRDGAERAVTITPVGAARLSSRRNRLAAAAAHVATTGRRLIATL
jgi:transposase